MVMYNVHAHVDVVSYSYLLACIHTSYGIMPYHMLANHRTQSLLQFSCFLEMVCQLLKMRQNNYSYIMCSKCSELL